jgi:hypothetical protein
MTSRRPKPSPIGCGELVRATRLLKSRYDANFTVGAFALGSIEP